MYQKVVKHHLLTTVTDITVFLVLCLLLLESKGFMRQFKVNVGETAGNQAFHFP